MLSEDSYYRKLPLGSRLIACARKGIARRDAVVIVKADPRRGRSAPTLLWLVQSRAMVIE